MYHTSSPTNRKDILLKGLQPHEGPRRCFGNELLPPAIFLALSEPFDTTFDDDVYLVDVDYTTLHIDTAMDDSYYGFETIPPEKLQLVKYGTGKDMML